ncbi:MAG TPA: hypothetical protein VLB01_06920, partial [Thermodesulfobacteriota bacterium]|nr:hypothetical protein [Thermodesulfobacteriota bacterium]
MNIDFREFEKEQSKFYQKEVKGKVVKNKNPIKEGTRMTCYLRISVIAVVVIFIMQFFAPESQAESLNEQIESLKRQMEEIQRQNQQQIEELQKKIEGLEQGAKETKAKVEEKEVEAKKEEEGAWWKQVEVSYKKPGDGFKLKTKDGNFSLRTRLRTQFQLSVNDTEDEDVATDFDIRRFRILFDGNAFTPWLLYYVQLRADSTDLELLDTYFDAAYNTLFVP